MLIELFGRFLRYLALAAGIPLLVLMFFTVVDVFLRNVLNMPLRSVYEFTVFLMAPIVFFAVAYTGWVGAHLAVDLFAGWLDRPPAEVVGDAVKAVNNALLAVNLAVAAEGLAALAHAGVSGEVALDVINASSGRSNVTENLIPERVLTRAFPRTFRLALLEKLNKEHGKTIVMVTHDPKAAGYASHTLHLDKGSLVESQAHAA